MIKLYAGIHCGVCKMLGFRLQQKNIEYEEITDEELMSELGILNVPVLEVEGKRMNSFEASEWITKQ